jgi:hypothetical protein
MTNQSNAVNAVIPRDMKKKHCNTLRKINMNKPVRHTKGITLADIKFYLALLLTVLALTLSGCSQSSNRDAGSVSNDTLSAPLPIALRALALDKTNLVVEVVDGSGAPQACTNLSVDQVNGTYSCTVTLSGGSHTLSLIFSVIDPTYGTVQVATTSGVVVDVVPGQTTPADFTLATLTLDDNDGDGISNLDELDAGTNPNSSECTLDYSHIGSCTLG